MGSWPPRPRCRVFEQRDLCLLTLVTFRWRLVASTHAAEELPCQNKGPTAFYRVAAGSSLSTMLQHGLRLPLSRIAAAIRFLYKVLYSAHGRCLKIGPRL